VRARTAGRVLLGLAALASVQIGVWALAFPRSFYDDFPGGGRSWVSADGPYNEHLVRDFGSLNLALAVVLGVAAWKALPLLVRTAAVAYCLFGVPHLLYHLRHLDLYDTTDKVANVVSLVLALVLVLVGAALLEARDDREPAATGAGPPPRR
jgi:hypothetical protein